MIRNCDQLPLTLTAFANWPPSTLYCTTWIGACGLVADPVKAKLTGICAPTIGDGNAPRLIVGMTAGNSRTMNVLVFSIVEKSGSDGVRRKR